MLAFGGQGKATAQIRSPRGGGGKPRLWKGEKSLRVIFSNQKQGRNGPPQSVTGGGIPPPTPQKQKRFAKRGEKKKKQRLPSYTTEPHLRGEAIRGKATLEDQGKTTKNSTTEEREFSREGLKRELFHLVQKTRSGQRAPRAKLSSHRGGGGRDQDRGSLPHKLRARTVALRDNPKGPGSAGTWERKGKVRSRKGSQKRPSRRWGNKCGGDFGNRAKKKKLSRKRRGKSQPKIALWGKKSEGPALERGRVRRKCREGNPFDLKIEEKAPRLLIGQVKEGKKTSDTKGGTKGNIKEEIVDPATKGRKKALRLKSSKERLSFFFRLW